MHRSIFVLTLTLIAVVILSVMVSRKPPIPEAEASIPPSSKMSLSPYRYNYDLDISSDTDPQYTVDDFIERGYDLWQKGNRKKAEDIFKTALLFDSGNAQVIRSIGELVFLDGRYIEACNYFSQYLTLKPDAVESYTNLSISLLCARDLTAAERIAVTGLDRHEKSEPGPFYLILSCIEELSGDSDVADAYLTKAHESLGADLAKLVSSEWASPVKKLPAYKRYFSDP